MWAMFSWLLLLCRPTNIDLMNTTIYELTVCSWAFCSKCLMTSAAPSDVKYVSCSYAKTLKINDVLLFSIYIICIRYILLHSTFSEEVFLSFVNRTVFDNFVRCYLKLRLFTSSDKIVSVFILIFNSYSWKTFTTKSFKNKYKNPCIRLRMPKDVLSIS